MGQDDGFETADVSVDLFDDDRVRKLARTVTVPELERAMIVYMAVLLARWREGRRVKPEDAVPLWLPSDRLVNAPELLRSVGLLDRQGRIPTKTWAKWYEPVRERRARNRDRWARYNASRTGGTAELPRGSDAATAPSVPFRSYPYLPRARSRERRLSREPGEEDDGRAGLARGSDGGDSLRSRAPQAGRLVMSDLFGYDDDDGRSPAPGSRGPAADRADGLPSVRAGAGRPSLPPPPPLIRAYAIVATSPAGAAHMSDMSSANAPIISSVGISPSPSLLRVVRSMSAAATNRWWLSMTSRQSEQGVAP